MKPTNNIRDRSKPDLVDPRPARRIPAELIKIDMEEGINPYGWNGFIVGSVLFDQGTQKENWMLAFVHNTMTKIIREEKQNGRT